MKIYEPRQDFGGTERRINPHRQRAAGTGERSILDAAHRDLRSRQFHQLSEALASFLDADAACVGRVARRKQIQEAFDVWFERHFAQASFKMPKPAEPLPAICEGRDHDWRTRIPPADRSRRRRSSWAPIRP